MIETSIENAPKLWDWIQAKRGVALWQSVNLSNPGATWLTPAVAADLSTSVERPTWQAANHPAEVEHDPSKINLTLYREIKRFRVAIRRANFAVKLTDASSARVDREMAKAGTDASYSFDYETQECVIFKPDSRMSLRDWAIVNGLAV